MEADGRLIQHVERIYEMRSESVRERDALCLAARQGTRLAVEREIAEAYVVHEADARAQLTQNVVRHVLLERRKLQMLQPDREIGGRQRRRLGDRLARHAHRKRFGLEPGAAASGAGLRELVLPEEHADVLLVALFLEPLEKGKDPQVAATRVVQQEVSFARRDVLPRGIEVDAAGTRGLAQQPPASLVAGLGPGIERAIDQRRLGVRDDQRLVVPQHRTEAVARGTRAARVVKGEKRWREQGRGAPAGRTRGVLGKAPPVTVV